MQIRIKELLKQINKLPTPTKAGDVYYIAVDKGEEELYKIPLVSVEYRNGNNFWFEWTIDI